MWSHKDFMNHCIEHAYMGIHDVKYFLMKIVFKEFKGQCPTASLASKYSLLAIRSFQNAYPISSSVNNFAINFQTLQEKI